MKEFSKMPYQLKILEEEFALCRIDDNSFTPNLSSIKSFFSITKEESGQVTIICDQDKIPAGIGGQISNNWRGIMFVEHLEFSMVGIISRISRILASNHIPILTISTYTNDYVFVSSRTLNEAVRILKKNGYSFISV